MDFFFFFLPDPERAVLCVSARYSFAMEDAVREQALLGRYCAFTVTPGLPFLVQLPDFFMFLYTLQWEVTLWHLLEVGIGKCVSVLFLYNKKGRAPFFFLRATRVTPTSCSASAMPQASTPSLPRFDSMLFATLQSASLRPTSAWRECVRTCFPPPSSSSSGGAPASSSGTAFVVPSPLTSRRAADLSRDCGLLPHHHHQFRTRGGGPRVDGGAAGRHSHPRQLRPWRGEAVPTQDTRNLSALSLTWRGGEHPFFTRNHAIRNHARFWVSVFRSSETHELDQIYQLLQGISRTPHHENGKKIQSVGAYMSRKSGHRVSATEFLTFLSTLSSPASTPDSDGSWTLTVHSLEETAKSSHRRWSRMAYGRTHVCNRSNVHRMDRM